MPLGSNCKNHLVSFLDVASQMRAPEVLTQNIQFSSQKKFPRIS